MIIGDKKNQAQLMGFVPSIKNNMSEWQIITAKIPDRGKAHLDVVLRKLLKLYEDKEGIIFPVEDYKAVVIIRLGIINNYSILKHDIEDKMPEHGCRVIARKMNAAGLKQIQIDLVDRNGGELSLYEEREKRKENVMLIVDDDLFVRKTLRETLAGFGEVHEVGDGSKVVNTYLEHNPDIVFLDIHMPGKDGLQVVDDIIEMDSDAFIVVFSADSVKENVLNAVSGGAAGFLAKPVKDNKLREYLKQCITFR